MAAANVEIRKRISDAGLKHWQVAAATGVDPSTLCAWLRFPLSGDRLARVEAAIRRLVKEGSADE